MSVTSSPDDLKTSDSLLSLAACEAEPLVLAPVIAPNAVRPSYHAQSFRAPSHSTYVPPDLVLASMKTASTAPPAKASINLDLDAASNPFPHETGEILASPVETRSPTITPEAPDTLPDLAAYGLAYIPSLQLLACLNCPNPRVLYKDIVFVHLEHVHLGSAEYKRRRASLRLLIQRLPNLRRTMNDVEVPEGGGKLVPYLPLYEGWRCIRCGFCTQSRSNRSNHWGDKHKGEPRPDGVFVKAYLQQLGGSQHLNRFFWVQPPSSLFASSNAGVEISPGLQVRRVVALREKCERHHAEHFDKAFAYTTRQLAVDR